MGPRPSGGAGRAGPLPTDRSSALRVPGSRLTAPPHRQSPGPSSEPLEFPTAGSYADPDADVEQPFEYYWQHSMGEIVSALAGAGLRIDFIHEYPFAVWQMYPFLVETEPRTWRLPAPLDGRLPLTFSLKATKT